MCLHIYEILVISNMVVVLFCSIKIKKNHEENVYRMKLLRKLQRERIALKRERVLTEDAIKRARACKVD